MSVVVQNALKNKLDLMSPDQQDDFLRMYLVSECRAFEANRHVQRCTLHVQQIAEAMQIGELDLERRRRAMTAELAISDLMLDALLVQMRSA